MENERELSDDEEREILFEACKTAPARAIRISKALGLSIHYIKDGKLIEELPDGSIKVIKVIERLKHKDKDKGNL